MDVNAGWIRWISASVAKHFNDSLANLQIPLFIEGADRETNQLPFYAEFRMNGPIFKKLTEDEFRVDIAINVLVTVKRSLTDLYLFQTCVGKVSSVFTSEISVFKLGNESEDDKSFFDCLLQAKIGDKTLQVEQIGQISCELLAVQAAVEGCYRTYLNL